MRACPLKTPPSNVENGMAIPRENGRSDTYLSKAKQPSRRALNPWVMGGVCAALSLAVHGGALWWVHSYRAMLGRTHALVDALPATIESTLVLATPPRPTPPPTPAPAPPEAPKDESPEGSAAPGRDRAARAQRRPDDQRDGQGLARDAATQRGDDTGLTGRRGDG